MDSLNICLVSDFFYPNTGGVETHQYSLSQCLIRRGHKVVLITHAYGERTGIRYLSDGLKVYYVPCLVIYNQATLPTVVANFPIFRQIFIREEIQVVHGHGSLSPFCHEAIFHARTMGLKTCLTDHSLFGFADTGSILTNKLLKFTLSDIDHVICVSHTSKENTVLRAALNPLIVSTIPNAIVGRNLRPDPTAADPNCITIVVACRLVYRKGIDLLVATIPRICQRYPEVKFIIGGDGPRRIDLEQMRETHVLQDRVELLGAVKASDIRKVLVRGNIFLNTSLTEAFGIGMVEAACCGLLVVTTKVGGVPEVLPEYMINFAAPEEDDLVQGISRAIDTFKTRDQHPELNPMALHQTVKQMYSWMDVAIRTERVYRSISALESPPLIERLRRYYGCGLWAGKLFCILAAVDYLLYLFLEWWWPRSGIERAPTFDYTRYAEVRFIRWNRLAREFYQTYGPTYKDF
ncbi:Phosphatidylinositol N-acetylglucosaminyltransferase GPI3 subunit [Dispira parvispora]|uniref:Phosphatidylinositol N-acetylglucosaminyltransferase GPI3 subunit n=1 Tax=Dispira parvispora TaxID=1520584 RepID=A0A9W8AVP8_9FUNG|nr:Phosphatidylinositol N-acetylglucosaminyltransferase GPI3 subunit [Dispira parvispora]